MAKLNLLDAEIKPEDFKPVEQAKGSPVSNDKVIENIKASITIDAPVFKNEKDNKKEGSFVFIAGGPTLLNYMDEVKKRYDNGEFICTSNLTHDFLIDNDIIPTITLVIDPKERVKDYIKKPHKDCTYYIGTVCHPEVAGKLLEKGANIKKLLVAYGMDDGRDIDTQMALYDERNYKDYLVGGTMAGLRAMPFALMHGYKKIEYYGFDSCFSDLPPNMIYEDINKEEYDKAIASGCTVYQDSQDGRKYAFVGETEGGYFYAYDKIRGETIEIAQTPDGRRFITSPVMSHQAVQLIKWAERLEGHLDIVIHGDSLSSHYYKVHRETIKKTEEKLGKKRWTAKYKKVQKEFREQKPGYGATGFTLDPEIVFRQIVAVYCKEKKPITFLDYGCGDGRLSKAIEQLFNKDIVQVTNYDPFVDKYSKEPDGPFDLVCCVDVMEHVERACVKNVIEHILLLTKKLVYFQIALVDSLKTLPDGRNAHITQKNAQWWADIISEHFQIGEASTDMNRVFLVGQPLAKEMEDTPIVPDINAERGRMGRYKGVSNVA